MNKISVEVRRCRLHLRRANVEIATGRVARTVGRGRSAALHHTLDAIRDSKRRNGPTLTIRALPTFIHQIKTGQFDR